MIDILKSPWHWAIAGALIGLVVPILLLMGNKKFGVSSSLRHICAMCIPFKIPFFQYQWKNELWNLFFVIGVVIGAFIASHLLTNTNDVIIAEGTQQILKQWGIIDYSELMPREIFSVSNIYSLKGLFFFVIGGFLVGFGTRYAGGCTSGHAIMGLSTLQLPSLIATICFMAGGFFSANVILPFIFKLLS